MADLSLPKLSVAVKFSLMAYKVLDPQELNLHITVYKTREFDE